MNKEEAKILGKESRIGLANVYRNIAHYILEGCPELIQQIDDKADMVIKQIEGEEEDG
ncbi:MAG: hypothetical protein GY853_16580 [PVC group bacterium]|nr:hypothetical protein [PVC group bacterium]